MWASFDEVTMARQDFFSRDDDYALSLSEDAGDKTIHAIIATYADWVSAVGKTVPEANKWYYIALTYNVDTKDLTLYLNGEKEAQINAPGGMEHRFEGPLTIGTFQDRYFMGKLDEIKIWDAALSAEQIKMEIARAESAEK